MAKNRVIRGYWSLESLKKEASKYKTIKEFRNGSPSAYSTCKQKKLLREVTSHLERTQRTAWTKEECLLEASKYTTRSSFSRNSSGAWEAAYKQGWLDECYKHMPLVGHRYRRAIYIYEFENNKAYVGLTHNYKERHNQHMITGPVYKEIKKSGIPTFLKFDIWMKNEEAVIAEQEFINLYVSLGWTLLNSAKAGALGSGEKFWTKEQCKKVVLKYKTLKKFQDSHNGAYQIIYRNKWNIELFKHFKDYRPKKKYTIEYCKKIALKYKSKSEFKKFNSTIYRAARKLGCFDIICKHMKRPKVHNQKHTLKSCLKIAKKYKTLANFRRNEENVYGACLKRGWSNEVTSHLIRRKKWTNEDLENEAKKYHKKSNFRKSSASAFTIAKSRGILDSICAHMNK